MYEIKVFVAYIGTYLVNDNTYGGINSNVELKLLCKSTLSLLVKYFSNELLPAV